MTEQEDPQVASGEASPPCPRCAGQMRDERATKRNPKAPDYKCLTDGCEGIIWPPREAGAASGAKPAGTADDPACPVCGGKMWDDRTSKRNPRAPDFKCRNKPRFKGGPGCEGVIWPPRDGERRPAAGGSKTPSSTGRTARGTAPPASPPPRRAEREFTDDEVPDFGDENDDLPF